MIQVDKRLHGNYDNPNYIKFYNLYPFLLKAVDHFLYFQMETQHIAISLSMESAIKFQLWLAMELVSLIDPLLPQTSVMTLSHCKDLPFKSVYRLEMG